MHPRYEPIADELVDHDLTLYPNHTSYTHLGCARFQVSLGIVLMSPNLSRRRRKNVITIILVALLLFGAKYIHKVVIHGNILWKSYPRMLLAYATALCLAQRGQDGYAGMIIIVDALMGVQSRHMASVLST
jgi:hypothetical protein